MFSRAIAGFVAAGLFAGATAILSADRHGSDQLVVPHADGQSGLCEPFECSVRIQQVFDASQIPGRLRIEEIDLFNNVMQSAESFVEPAHYQFFLSVTRASSASASADMDANIGRNQTQVADFTVSDFTTSFTGALPIRLAHHFDYDPRKGNLLLEIRKDRTANFGDGPIYVDGTTQAQGIALVTDQFGVQRGLGMSVGFVGRLEGPFSHR